jgi:pimeloyl-CoA synthetase
MNFKSNNLKEREMQNLILLTSMLLMTSSSFCQTDTTEVKTPPPPQKTLSINTLKNDTIIGIPKTLTLYLIQDAIKADSYAEEIVLLKKGLDIKQEVITKQDTVIQLHKQKEAGFRKQINDCNDLVSEFEAKNIGLEKQVVKKTRAKRFWFTVAIAATASIFITHYSWKESVPW